MYEVVNIVLTLLNLLKLNLFTTKTLALLIVSVPVVYLVLQSRYPCITPPSLLKMVQLAKETFEKCVWTESFNEGEYDGYNRRLHRITSRALEITLRTPGSHHRCFAYPKFFWKRFNDTVDCHREARSLVRDLKFSLLRASRGREEYALQGSTLRVADGHRVDDHLV